MNNTLLLAIFNQYKDYAVSYLQSFDQSYLSIPIIIVFIITISLLSHLVKKVLENAVWILSGAVALAANAALVAFVSLAVINACFDENSQNTCRFSINNTLTF